MTSEPKILKIKVSDADTVTGMLYLAAKAKRVGVTLILGHGAGADQTSGFMVLYANGLAQRGLDVLTFNFIYKEKGRGAPDQKAKLDACYAAVIAAAGLEKDLKGNQLMIGGKSMGGRIASQVAATGVGDLAGLTFLGYPLHPPGKPEQLRSAHLQDIRAPLLFLQGSRDAFGSADEIAAVAKECKLNATLYFIEGGDHSFKVPKRAGLTQAEVHEAAMDEIARWAQSQI